jgi:hypothetical protein
VVPDECYRTAQQLAAEAARRKPGVEVTKIELTSADGAYLVEYTGGSGYGVQG